MAPKIEFIPDDNTDREFPDALEVIDAEFKVNGEYLCVEPCGDEGGKHEEGDVYLYIDIDGDDINGDGGELSPFASIERTFHYINTIVSIGGSIYINIGSGDFYINNSITVNHQNKIFISGYPQPPSSTINISDFVLVYPLVLTSDDNNILFGDIIFTTHIKISTDALFIGGYSSFPHTNIEIIEFAIGGATTAFGTLTIGVWVHGSCSDGVIGITGGGTDTGGTTDAMEKIEFAIGGNATSFGTLSGIRYRPRASSNLTEAFFSGGVGPLSVIDKSVFSIGGNAVYFGDLFLARSTVGACSDETTSFCGGGYSTAYVSLLDKLLFSTGGTATDFGDIIINVGFTIGESDNITGIFGTGYDGSDRYSTINKVTLAIGGIATSFGDAGVASYYATICSNNTNALIGGGSTASGNIADIDDISFATGGTATSFGNLSTVRYGLAGCAGR